jgi:hypothetical protein
MFFRFSNFKIFSNFNGVLKKIFKIVLASNNKIFLSKDNKIEGVK